MHIISFKKIKEFIERYPDADVALRDWYKKAEKSKWTSFSDIKKTFNSVDIVGDCRFIFNIKGNNYRLVAIVLFKVQRMYIRFIGTHKEYDKIDCSKI